MRAKGIENAKDTSVAIKVTYEEKDRIKELADKRDLTVSKFLHVILKETGII